LHLINKSTGKLLSDQSSGTVTWAVLSVRWARLSSQVEGCLYGRLIHDHQV